MQATTNTMNTTVSLSTNSNVLYDNAIAFVSSYLECSDLMVSSMFAKIGLYNVAKVKLDKETRVLYRHKFDHALTSHIWSEFGHLSTSLQCSMLYTTLSYGERHISKMNDICLSSTVKNFKIDMATFIREHAFFISYCEMEKQEVFMFTNGSQGLTHNDFLDLYESTRKSLDNLYQKYKGRLCKSIKSILDDFAFILDIRIQKDDRMCTSIENPSLCHLTKYCKVDPRELKRILNQFNKGSIIDVQTSLKKAYIIMMPFYVISDVKFLIVMQGSRKQEQKPLTTYFTNTMFDNVLTIRETIQESDGMYMLKEMTHLNFMNTVFHSLQDTEFFNEYSPDHLGEYVYFHITNILKFFVRNVDIIVLADLLAIGLYDMLGKEWQMDTHQVHSIIERAEYDITNMMDHYSECSTMQKMTFDSIQQFSISLKKVKRYYRWLVCQSDDNVSTHNEEPYSYHKLNDMVFGTMVDKEGQSMTCALCLDSAEERKDTWFALPCGHSYHMDCVNTLISNNISVCPLCRHCFE